MAERVSEQYPPAPPPCLRPETLGEICQTPDGFRWCGYQPNCYNLALGQAYLQDREESISSRFDGTIPCFYTGTGIRRKISREPALGNELSTRSWGLIYGDVRALKWLNDIYSEPAGDNLLRIVAKRIINEAGIRAQVRDVPVNTRHSHVTEDFGIRAGGDELALLIRNVTPEQLLLVENRQRHRFSVAQARIDSEIHHKVPTVVSLSSVHATEVDPAISDVETLLDQLFVEAQVRHAPRKLAQYEEMVQTVNEVRAPGDEPYIALSDHRLIAGAFITECCTYFAGHTLEMLEREASMLG